MAYRSKRRCIGLSELSKSVFPLSSMYILYFIVTRIYTSKIRCQSGLYRLAIDLIKYVRKRNDGFCPETGTPEKGQSSFKKRIRLRRPQHLRRVWKSIKHDSIRELFHCSVFNQKLSDFRFSLGKF
jgi:hypothetical protein